MRAKRPSPDVPAWDQPCRRALAGTSGEANPLNHPSPLETIRSEDDRFDYRKPDGNSTLPCPPLWMGSHGRRPGPADSSEYPPVKSRWSGIRRGGDLSSERRCPPRMPSNFHISHKNHWTTGKKMYRVLPSYGTTARSSCGRQATRALVRPVYQPIQTVGAEKDRTRRHPGPDGSGRSVGASRARDQNLRISHGGRRQSLSGHCPARADH